MKRLTIIRHAKSARDNPQLMDIQRPLNSRGKKDALRMAAYYRQIFPMKPDRVEVSPAQRTRMTLLPFLSEWRMEVEDVKFNPEIYEASCTSLLDIVHAWSSDIENAVLIGHNPGMYSLTNLCINHRPMDKFPTCAIAVLESEEGWEKWGSCCAELKLFMTPKKLPLS